MFIHLVPEVSCAGHSLCNNLECAPPKDAPAKEFG